LATFLAIVVARKKPLSRFFGRLPMRGRECRYEGPADCAVGAESAGAGVLGEAVPSTSSMKSRCRVSRPQLGRKDAPDYPTEATKTDHEHQEKLPVSVEKLMPKLMAFDQDMEITVKLHRKPVPAS